MEPACKTIMDNFGVNRREAIEAINESERMHGNYLTGQQVGIVLKDVLDKVNG